MDTPEQGTPTSWWEKLKRDLKERFLNFETAKGFYLIPAGLAISYVAAYYMQYLMQTAGVLFGWYWASIGVWKIFINPVKAEAEHWNRVEARQQEAKAKAGE